MNDLLIAVNASNNTSELLLHMLFLVKLAMNRIHNLKLQFKLNASVLANENLNADRLIVLALDENNCMAIR